MKRKLLCSAIAIVIVLFLMPYFTWAQRITQLAPNTIKVEQSYYPCSASVSPCFIMHTVPPGPVYSSSSASPGTRTIWLEYGDGGFTTDPTKARDIYGSPGNPLLLVNKLYDTSRDNFRIYSQLPLSQNTNTQRTSDNDFVMLSGNPGNSIKITPNAYDIIQRDTMCFAVTYKLNNPVPTGVKYFLVFRYNSNVFVAPGSGLIGQPNPQQAFTLFTDPQNYPQGIPIQFVRTYHGETAPSSAFITGITNFLGSNSNYTNGVVTKLNTNPSSPLNSVTFTENNLFISLITKNPLANGNTTGIDAQLIQLDSTGVYTTLADYPLEGMGVVFAHDPNYITQSPVCMQLPKIVRDMKYHIHFQNTGRGPADTVKITANLPFGLDLATCQLDRVVYSGYNYAIGINNDHNELDTTLDQLRNKIIFTLYKTSSNINSNISNNNLEGTDNVYNPAVNPETMGDIYFTVSATVNVPYSLPAQATIEFHSSASPIGLWENPVATNIAVSNYSSCCNCNLFDCDKNEKGNGPNIKKAAVKKIKPD